MSVPATTSILPDQAFLRPKTPLKTPLDPYFDAFWNASPEPDFGLTSQTPMLLLPAVTLATMELRAAPTCSWRPTTRGLVTEASFRMALWQERGSSLSGWAMALNLQSLFFRGTGERRDKKVPRLGLDLLRCVDLLSAEGTELWCDIPDPDNAFTLRTVRLRDAIERFER